MTIQIDKLEKVMAINEVEGFKSVLLSFADAKGLCLV